MGRVTKVKTLYCFHSLVIGGTIARCKAGHASLQYVENS